MDTKKVYAILYIALLNAVVPAFCLSAAKLGTSNQDDRAIEDEATGHRVRRTAVAPIAVYGGALVSPWVWAAILAVYGAALLSRYGVIETDSDSHNCANNRGWCRSRCFSHEWVDWFNTPVCGNYVCCRP